MKKCTFAEYRDWVIINLLLNNGCRTATIRNIQIKDVDIENKVIYLRHTKKISGPRLSPSVKPSAAFCGSI